MNYTDKDIQAIVDTQVELKTKDLQQKIDKALKIAFEYSQIDGSHHKAWVIDQMVRSLLDDNYKKEIEKYMFDGQDPVEAIQNENYFKWDIGVAP